VTRLLRANRASATVDPNDGGRLVSLMVDSVELLTAGIPGEGMPTGWYHGSFPMAPYAGRVKNGRFVFHGAEHQLPRNAEPHAGHGLVFDVPWTVEDSSVDRLTCCARLDDRWPFGGEVRQTFALDDGGLSVLLELANDSRAMPGSLGLHPWFRRDLGNGPVRLAFSPAQRLAPGGDGFPRVLSGDLGERPWDDVFTGLSAPPELSWPGGPTLRILSSHDLWIVYEQQASGICVEPITAPPDSLGAGAATIAPGAPLALSVRFEWGS
jgi:aldose 1-epimerase